MPHGYSGKILHVDLSSVSLRQEAPAHMPQLKKGLGLIYATNPFGADHMSCEHNAAYEKAFKYYRQRLEFLGLTKPQAPLSLNAEKIAFARKTQHLASLMDSLTACQFVWGASWHLYGPKEIVKLVQAVTGWDVERGVPTSETLQRLGLELD